MVNLTLANFEMASEPWEDWSPEEYPETHFAHQVDILGVPHFLELVRVRVANGMQEPVDPGMEQFYQDVFRAARMDGHFQTVELEGREFIVVMTPYGE